jgi:hypothetical protein
MVTRPINLLLTHQPKQKMRANLGKSFRRPRNAYQSKEKTRDGATL